MIYNLCFRAVVIGYRLILLVCVFSEDIAPSIRSERVHNGLLFDSLDSMDRGKREFRFTRFEAVFSPQTHNMDSLFLQLRPKDLLNLPATNTRFITEKGLSPGDLSLLISRFRSISISSRGRSVVLRFIVKSSPLAGTPKYPSISKNDFSWY